jgi:hypothetical protein
MEVAEMASWDLANKGKIFGLETESKISTEQNYTFVFMFYFYVYAFALSNDYSTVIYW